MPSSGAPLLLPAAGHAAGFTSGKEQRMRIVQYVQGGQTHVGTQVGDEVFVTGYADTLSLIRDGEAGLEAARDAVGGGDAVRYERLLAPLSTPGKILGSGVNYRSHGDEEPGFVFPDEPVWDFIK